MQQPVASSDMNGAHMNGIGDRIRQARVRMGLSQSELGDLLGVTRGAVANWERDKGIKRENLAAMAEKLGVGLEWLMLGAGSQPPQREPANIARNSKRDLFAYDNLGAPRIPAYGQAMGGQDGYFVLNGNKIAELLAPPALVGVKDANAVYVSGDSMEPRYFAGEALFVNPRLPVRRGDFVVVQIQYENETVPRGYVKRFLRTSDEWLVLEQYNPAKELRFPASQVQSIHRIVLGGDG
jgi:phage repressor protein C with HTH and peptisase S24 domain